MELVVAFRQQAVDLAGRDVDTQVQQFLVDQRLRDAVLMVLVEHVAAKPRSKMPLDVRRQRGRPTAAVGQKVAQPPVADIMGFDLQVLDHEVLVTVLPRVLGQPFQRHGDRLMDHQLACLLPFGRTRPFASSPSSVRGIGMGRVERARPDHRSRRESLQSGNLVAQLPGSPPATPRPPAADDLPEAFVLPQAPRCRQP